VAIAYWAEVRWKRLRQGLCGLLLSTPDAPGRWRFSGRGVAPPAAGAGVLRWRAAPLDLEVEFSGCAPAFEHRLFGSDGGVVDWSCRVPRAEVRLRAGGKRMVGAGYAELLDMTLLPWKLPADEIRWGRFLGPATSLVWIDWRGDHPQRLLFRDGRQVHAGSISEDAIRFDGGELVLRPSRVVSDDLLGGLLAPLRSLRPVVAPITRTHQTRWLSSGSLHEPGAPEPASGWAIHELVRRR
jgi:hypothetical protein